MFQQRLGYNKRHYFKERKERKEEKGRKDGRKEGKEKGRQWYEDLNEKSLTRSGTLLRVSVLLKLVADLNIIHMLLICTHSEG